MPSAAEVFIHETAIVEASAQIGAGSKVWHQSHVRGTARIGADCILGKNVYVDAEAEIGDRVKIQNNVSVYHGVHIAADVFVGPSATFTNDRVPRAFNDTWTVVETWVETGASIGANATIVCGNRIGEYAMVAAGSVVTRDVAPHQIVAGNPARGLGWVCRCGTVISRDASLPADLECDACREGDDAHDASSP